MSQHDVSPAPEVVTLRAAAERTLERMAVRIDETGEAQTIVANGHGWGQTPAMAETAAGGLAARLRCV
jgi:hypothetical protein